MKIDVVFKSDLYRVVANEDGERRDIPVYQSLIGYMRPRDAAHVQMEPPPEVLAEYNGLGADTRLRPKTVKTYYTAYTFAKEAEIEITLPGSVKTVTVKPAEAERYVRIQENRVTVHTDRKLYFVLYPDGDIFGGLRVFLDRERKNTAPKKHVLAFTDGIYTAENCDMIHLNEEGAPVIDGIEDDTLIYIGKNAIVHAAILLRGVKNVEIAGTGILTTLDRCEGAESGFAGTFFLGLFRENALPSITVLGNCEGIAVRDVLIDAEFRGIVLRNSKDIRIENVKIFTSTHNADGINGYNVCGLAVSGCFIQSRDDCFCLYNSCDSIPWLRDDTGDAQAICRDIEFWDCTLLSNCRPFVFGGHATGAKAPRCLIEDLYVHDCAVIETLALLNHDEKFAFYWTSVFRILSQSEQVVRGLTFENILVDATAGYCGKIFDLEVRDASRASYTECRGFAIENIVFRNIKVRGYTAELYPSLLLCRAAEADESGEAVPHVSDVRFENVWIGDRRISAKDLRTEGNVKGMQI